MPSEKGDSAKDRHDTWSVYIERFWKFCCILLPSKHEVSVKLGNLCLRAKAETEKKASFQFQRPC